MHPEPAVAGSLFTQSAQAALRSHLPEKTRRKLDELYARIREWVARPALRAASGEEAVAFVLNRGEAAVQAKMELIEHVMSDPVAAAVYRDHTVPEAERVADGLAPTLLSASARDVAAVLRMLQRVEWADALRSGPPMEHTSRSEAYALGMEAVISHLLVADNMMIVALMAADGSCGEVDPTIIHALADAAAEQAAQARRWMDQVALLRCADLPDDLFAPATVDDLLALPPSSAPRMTLEDMDALVSEPGGAS